MTDQTLRQCSFQGIPFFFSSITDKGGRRLSINDLPFQDKAYIQDMGRNNQRLNVSFYVTGDDPENLHRSVKDQADFLKQALNQEGTGLLELAYFPDRLKVIAGEYSVSYSGQSRVDFDCEFIVTEERTPIITVTQRLERSNDLLDSFFQALYRDINRITNFTNDVLGGVEFLLSASYALETWKYTLNDALGFVEDLFNHVSLAFGDDRTRITRSIKNLKSSDSLEFEPYFEVLRDIATVQKTGSPISGFEEALNYQPVTVTYPSRSNTLQQSGLNETTLSHAFKQAFIASYAVSLGQQEFTTRQQAIYHRALLSDELDQEYAHVIGESFDALTDVTNNAASYITNRISDLVPVVTVEGHKRQLPAVWWSYRLYGSLDYVEDLIQRNNIADPSFMPLSFQAVAWE